MTITWSHACAAVAICLVAVSPALAHHAFSAEFDAAKPIRAVGVVTVLEWTNPHAHILVDVKDDAGTVTSWNFELGSPNALIRRGWLKSSLKPGDKITIAGYVAKDGSHNANARNVTLSDGRTIFAGTSLDSGPAK